MILPLLKPIFLFNSLKLAQFFYIKQRMELLCLLQVYKLVVTCSMFESFQFLIIFFLSNLGPFLASSICECQYSKWWRKKFCAWNWHQGQNYGSVGRSLKTSMILDRKGNLQANSVHLKYTLYR